MAARSDSSTWRVSLLYLALTVALAYPLTRHPATTVLSSGPDTDLFMWTLAWDTHAFTHQPFTLFDANIYSPERHTLAYSENLIGSAFFAAPVLWLTHNPVLAMNLVALQSAVLCGIGTFMLARRTGAGTAGAVLAGLVFAFSPPRFLRLDQLHLATIQWIPFSLAFLHAYLDEGRPLHLRLAVAFFALQALSSGHGAVFLIVGSLGLLTYRVALGEPVAPARRLRDLGWQGALLGAPIALSVLPYLAVQREMGLKRSLENWAVGASSFIASPSHFQGYLLSLLPDSRINETADAYLFPGFLPLALAAVAVCWPRRSGPSSARRAGAWSGAAAVFLEVATLTTLALGVYATAAGAVRVKVGTTVLVSVREVWRVWIACGVSAALRAALVRRTPIALAARGARWRDGVARWADRHRRDALTFYLLLTLASVWLSVGPPVGVWPLVYWLPGLNLIRVPSRFTLLAMLGLAILAGLGFERMTMRVGSRARVAAAFVVGALLLGEFAAMPFATEPWRVEIPAIDRWLASRPAPFVVAEVPLPDPGNLGAAERRQTMFMLHSTAHWQKTVHGYSGFRPARHQTLYAELTNFPDETSLKSLRDLGVNYIVVHTDLYEPGEWKKVEERLGRFSKSLTLEHVEGEGRVYSRH